MANSTSVRRFFLSLKLSGSALKLSSLALKLLLRDWRSGTLRVLLFSLTVAVATVTSISLFTSRIHNSILDEATAFLAADLKVSGSLPIQNHWLWQAKNSQLSTATTTVFSSMVFAGEDMLLSQVKAVSAGYPLKGSLVISDRNRNSVAVNHGPQAGQVWLAPRIVDALDLQLGDSVFIGDGEFTLTAILEREPDNSQSLFGISPRAMIHQQDIEKTNAIQAGSRITFSLLVAGEEQSVATFRSWMEEQKGEHFRLTDVNNSNRSVANTLAKAESFLLLAGSLSVILGGAAITLAARRYALQKYSAVALLKTLGTTPRHIVFLFLLLLISIGLATVLLGGLLGWLLHWGILISLGDLAPKNIASASAGAYVTGALTGLLSLLAFAAPPLLSLRRVLPVEILRGTTDKMIKAYQANGLGFLAIILLIFLYSRDLTMTLLLTAAGVACLAGVFILSLAAIKISKRVNRLVDYSWRIGINNLARRRQANAIQVMIFAILLFLIATLVAVRTHLIQQWQNQLPPQAANHFVFNIYEDDIEDIAAFFLQEGIRHSPFYPMTRGRVLDINGIPAATLAEQYNKDNINYERELNLTASLTLGEDNNILQGVWWPETGELSNKTSPWLISVEQAYAKGLNIQLGDTVTLSLAGQQIKAKVHSIRSVEWDSMNPNFFIIFNKPIAKQFGANWLTSFYLDSGNKPFINRLAKRYPTVSIIELDQTLDQIRGIIDKITRAIEFILLLVTLSGLLVLITSIQATLDSRLKESAILRTLGASKALVRKTLIVEFACLGLLAGLLAIVGTEIALYFLQTQTFKLNYAPFPLLWPIVPLVGMVFIGTIGWLYTKHVVNTSPMPILRNTCS